MELVFGILTFLLLLFLLIGPFFSVFLITIGGKTGWIMWSISMSTSLYGLHRTYNIGENYRKIGDTVISVQSFAAEQIFLSKLSILFCLSLLAWYLNANNAFKHRFINPKAGNLVLIGIAFFIFALAIDTLLPNTLNKGASLSKINEWKQLEALHYFGYSYGAFFVFYGFTKVCHKAFKI
jgi:hypothetical protein